MPFEAETLFKKVLAKDPNMEIALRGYARLLLYRSQEYVDAETTAAIALLQRALNTSPKFAYNHFYLGLAFSFLDDHKDEAIAHVHECLRLKPGHKKAVELLAELTQGELASDGSESERGEGATNEE